jgi:hypothetical protein
MILPSIVLGTARRRSESDLRQQSVLVSVKEELAEFKL